MNPNYKKCAICGKEWNVSRFCAAHPYICPRCEKKKAREAWRARLRKVGIVS